MNTASAPLRSVFLLFVFSWTSLVSASETEDRLAAIKAELPFISLGDYLYDREPWDRTANGAAKAAWAVLIKLHDDKLQTAELIRLTSGPDANTRALALLGLLGKETPDVVPPCMRLVNDQDPILSEEFPSSDSGGGVQPLFTRPLTVAGVARKILEMSGAQLKWLSDGRVEFSPDAASWAGKRNGNPDWLAFQEFLYKRATQAATSLREERRPLVRRFMTKVEGLPGPSRFWLLLYLADDIFMVDGYWHDYYASEQEMIQAAKRLGAEALIDFLKTGKRKGLREPSLDDSRNGRRFLVTYAKQLFSPANAADLMDLKLFTAAADADPSLARKAASAGMAYYYASPCRSWDRAKIMAALADLGDATDRATAVQWFYEEPDHNQSTPQSIFITAVEQRRPKEWEDIVRRIVPHPDFEKLIPMDTIYLALMVNRLGGKKIFDPSLFREDQIQVLRRRLRELFGKP